jgi:hypothetical protein
MSLVGTYVNQSTGETLQIKEANDNIGQLSGVLSIPFNGQVLNAAVTGHYHFVSSIGPQTSITFTGVVENSSSTPSIYEGWAGVTDANNYAQLNMLGSKSVLDASGKSSVCTLGGPFVRQ